MKESPQPNNQKAVISAVSGVIALVVGLFASCLVFFVFPPLIYCTGFILLAASCVALITGYLARDEIRRTGEEGAGMAQAGLVMGGVGLLVVGFSCICMVLSVGGLALMEPQIGNIFSEIQSTLTASP